MKIGPLSISTRERIVAHLPHADTVELSDVTSFTFRDRSWVQTPQGNKPDVRINPETKKATIEDLQCHAEGEIWGVTYAGGAEIPNLPIGRQIELFQHGDSSAIYSDDYEQPLIIRRQQHLTITLFGQTGSIDW